MSGYSRRHPHLFSLFLFALNLLLLPVKMGGQMTSSPLYLLYTIYSDPDPLISTCTTPVYQTIQSYGTGECFPLYTSKCGGNITSSFQRTASIVTVAGSPSFLVNEYVYSSRNCQGSYKNTSKVTAFSLSKCSTHAKYTISTSPLPTITGYAEVSSLHYLYI